MRNRQSTKESNSEEESTPFIVPMTSSNDMPTAQELLAMSPAKYGFAEKKNNSIGSKIFPCLYPKFKRRYFILIGNFLFRYSSEFGEKPKGVPIPLDTVTSTFDASTMVLSTIRKVYVIRLSSPAECQSWIKEIRLRQAQAIRENMGHVPVSPALLKINKVGSKLFAARLKKDSVQGESIFNPLSPTMAP